VLPLYEARNGLKLSPALGWGKFGSFACLKIQDNRPNRIIRPSIGAYSPRFFDRFPNAAASRQQGEAMHIREKSEKLFSALFNEVTSASNESSGNIYVEKAKEFLKQDGFDFLGIEEKGPFKIALFEHNTTNEQLLILHPNGITMFDGSGQDIGYPLLIRESSEEAGYLADYLSEKLWHDQSKSTGPKMFPG
jgi:hypothetical protein